MTLELDRDSAAWWEAVAERRLLLPLCRSCGQRWFPPTPGCPHCGSSEVELAEASGRGTIYSWVVVNRALSPDFAGDVPYAVLAVDLEEGARMFGRLLGGGDPAAGGAVHVEFYEAGGRTLPGFAM